MTNHPTEVEHLTAVAQCNLTEAHQVEALTEAHRAAALTEVDPQVVHHTEAAHLMEVAHQAVHQVVTNWFRKCC